MLHALCLKIPCNSVEFFLKTKHGQLKNGIYRNTNPSMAQKAIEVVGRPRRRVNSAAPTGYGLPFRSSATSWPVVVVPEKSWRLAQED